MARTKKFTAAGDLQFQKYDSVQEQDKKADGGAKENASPEKGFAMIDASLVVSSPFNEGLDMSGIDEYAESLKESGLIEPISVYALHDGRYEILSGHQRFKAWCGILGNKTIKASVLPYEEDPVARFRAHTAANVLQRDKNIGFWLSRIGHARQVLEETGFSGTKAEEMQKISELLGGISVPQIYRFESFKKLIPELQELEAKHLLSVNTLYAAVSLDVMQQRKVRDMVDDLQAAKSSGVNGLEDDLEITREEFKRIVAGVRNGKKTARRSVGAHTYSEKISKAAASLIGTMTKCRTPEEKEEVRKQITELRSRLDEIEQSL